MHPHRFIIDNAGFQLSKFIEVLVHMLLFFWIGNVPTLELRIVGHGCWFLIANGRNAGKK